MLFNLLYAAAERATGCANILITFAALAETLFPQALILFLPVNCFVLFCSVFTTADDSFTFIRCQNQSPPFWHGRKDSNFRHPVLETGVLPTELLPHTPKVCYFTTARLCVKTFMLMKFSEFRLHRLLAPPDGFEPPTPTLTAYRSTN